MNILGIIAELNPLHTGHEYLIRKLRRETDAEFCVVAMSGDYVQRGEPALFSKYLRTKAALLSGADLVLELPLSVSTGSAEYFAEGAVSLLARLGCVTHLGFGSENGDINAFRLAGRLLSEEPESYRMKLQAHLREGMNFPRARYEALSDLPDVLPLLTSPNNILGVEYCKALHKLHAPMIPVTVKRLGAGYHETLTYPDGEYREERKKPDAESTVAPPCPTWTMLSGDDADDSLPRFASASGLRKAFLCSQNNASADGQKLEVLLQNYVPTCSHPLYAEALQAGQYVTFDQFFLPLYHILQYSDAEALSRCQDVTEAFAERLLRLFGDCSSVTELCGALKAKNLTSAGISRALLHILLCLTKENVRAEREQGFALYARILGFRKEAKALLSEIDRCADIPLVSKPADARRRLAPSALTQLELTRKASELYRAAMPGTKPQSEYAQRIIVL